MLFNSLEFLFFLVVVFGIYWFIFQHNLKLQNLFLLIVSYVFYGWWDWRFLILIAFTSFCSFISGLGIERASTRRVAKWISASNIVLNLGILVVFKYYNFFVGSFAEFLNITGGGNSLLIKIILPVGISFYTFQALSYSIDVYRGKLPATKDIIAFFAYISFFPQLVAGPIERATNLLPQFYHFRTFDYSDAVCGVRQILLGFFKKIAIADSCALIVNPIFADYTNYGSAALVLGAVLFSFQIYGDFSGYSDIAIGTARLFGFHLMKNFHYPYFSRDIAEFWRRWHISLNTWFRDYVYIPLGGSRVRKGLVIRNTFVIFLLSGLWHGANWTFLAWGAFHALLFIPLLLSGRNRRYTDVVAQNTILPSLSETVQMLLTFVCVTIGWIIFRSDTISDAWHYLTLIVSPTSCIFIRGLMLMQAGEALLFIFVLLLMEWIGRREEFALAIVPRGFVFRWSLYMALAVISVLFFRVNQAFIYFQF